MKNCVSRILLPIKWSAPFQAPGSVLVDVISYLLQSFIENYLEVSE